MDELTLLKERATQMGLTFHPSIGVEALKRKVDAHLNGTPGDENPAEDHPKAHAQAQVETKAQREMRVRNAMQKEYMRLIRIRVSNLDPSKASLQGEIVTVSNRYLGSVRKMIPFGDANEAGYHVPLCIYLHLKDKKFNQVKTRKGSKPGEVIIEQRMVPEYAIEILDPLTQDEINNLARMQAAAAGA